MSRDIYPGTFDIVELAPNILLIPPPKVCSKLCKLHAVNVQSTDILPTEGLPRYITDILSDETFVLN